jgi:hypothetical protein
VQQKGQTAPLPPRHAIPRHATPRHATPQSLILTSTPCPSAGTDSVHYSVLYVQRWYFVRYAAWCSTLDKAFIVGGQLSKTNQRWRWRWRLNHSYRCDFEQRRDCSCESVNTRSTLSLW